MDLVAAAADLVTKGRQDAGIGIAHEGHHWKTSRAQGLRQPKLQQMRLRAVSCV